MLGVDDVSAILNSAVMLESPVVLPENEGKMVIIFSRPFGVCDFLAKWRGSGIFLLGKLPFVSILGRGSQNACGSYCFGFTQK